MARGRRVLPPERPGPRIPPLVNALPATTPVVVFAPRLATALMDGERLLQLLAKVDASLDGRTVAHLVGALWRPTISNALTINPGADTDLARLVTTEGLAAIGVDANAPFALVPSEDGRSVVAIFGVSNRKRFDRWLSAVEGPERSFVKIGGEQASVLAATSDVPVVCIVRKLHAYCQVGASGPNDAVGPLSRLLSFDGTTIGRSETRRNALEALPRGAHLYASIEPNGLARIFGHAMVTHAHTKARFFGAKAQKPLVERARGKAKRLARWSKLIAGAATGVYPGDNDVVTRSHVILNGTGRRLADRLVPDGVPDPTIRRWSETPALVRMLARVDHELVAAIASDLGLPLPNEALSGTFAMMVLGVDAECPAARAEAAAANRHWAFLMPTAFSIGVRNPRRADELHGALKKRLAPLKSAVASGDRSPLRGEIQGGRFEVNVLDDMVLVGTGRGSAAAALRRLGALPTTKVSQRSAFFEADIDLRAIDEAFASGSFGHDHRAELLAIEALRLQMKPLLETVDSVRLSVHKRHRGRALLFVTRAGR